MSRGKTHGDFYTGIVEETYYSKDEIRERISDEYIRGLIEGEGHFGSDLRSNGIRIPCFVLKMHARDKELIEGVRDYFRISNRVYEYTHQERHYAMLIIRDIPTLKNKIVPLFNNKLLGFKGTQFSWWLGKFPYLSSALSNKPWDKRPTA